MVSVKHEFSHGQLVHTHECINIPDITGIWNETLVFGLLYIEQEEWWAEHEQAENNDYDKVADILDRLNDQLDKERGTVKEA